MIFQTLFSEKALAKRAQGEAVDARLQVTAPHEWLLVSAIGVAFLALLSYGLFGEVETSLSVEAVVVKPGERVDLVAHASGVVTEVFAGVGDTLVEGAPIARVRLSGAANRAANFNADGLDRREQPDPADPTTREADTSATYDIVAPRDGELAMRALVAGQRIEAAELVARVRAASDGPPEVLAFVSPEDTLRLSPNMPAGLRVAVPGEGRFRILPTRIEQVSPRADALPAWLGELGLDPPAHARLLRASLTDPQPVAIFDGTRGTLRIVLDRRSFVAVMVGGDRH